MQYIWKKMFTPSNNLGCPCDSKSACNYIYPFLMHKHPCQVINIRVKEVSMQVQTLFLMTLTPRMSTSS
jgi:hypothetical protein